MELLDNNYLLQYKAQTFTEKLKESIIKHTLEEEEERLGYTPRLTETALVIAHTTGEKFPEIKALGASTLMKEDNKITKDLVLNNFMRWFSGWFGEANRDITMKDRAGADFTVRVNGSGFNRATVPVGTGVQVGDGVTVPLRTDVDIVNAFPDAPQSDINDTNDGGWNSAAGKITVAKSIVTATNNGTVIEVGLFAFFRENTNTQIISMLTRDKLSPVVPWVVGETLNITCTFTM